MKVTIFGATGSVGRHLVQQALEKGHAVIALTRQPDKLADIHHPQLTVVQGNILYDQDVDRAVRGADAVFCAIGDGSQGRIRAAGTERILAAMTANGVRRFICQTTLGLGESRQNLNFFWRYVMFGLVLRRAFLDHVRQEQLIMDSDLDYTIVRPSAFTDGPRTADYQMGFDGNLRKLKLKISRADVADCMLRILDASGSYRRKAVSISH